MAEVLRKANASLVADLLLNRGNVGLKLPSIGLELATKEAFTLLIPSDPAIEKLTLKTWKDLNTKKPDGPDKDDAFDRWYAHHYASKRLLAKDVAAGANKLELKDRREVLLRLDGDRLMIKSGGKEVAITATDIIWKKGVIHILEEELLQAGNPKDAEAADGPDGAVPGEKPKENAG